jgi:hypothetical protein
MEITMKKLFIGIMLLTSFSVFADVQMCATDATYAITKALNIEMSVSQLTKSGYTLHELDSEVIDYVNYINYAAKINDEVVALATIASQDGECNLEGNVQLILK